MKTGAFYLFLVGMAGLAVSAPSPGAEEPAPSGRAGSGLTPEIINQRNQFEQEAKGDDPVRAMDASLRLWNHYRAQGDTEKARMWQERFYELLRQRANEGEVHAMVYLGGLYAKGNDLIPKDMAKAREWFEKAAEAGDPNAQYQVAIYYLQGIGGARDEAKAAEWFGKALNMMKAKADHGDAQAAFWVGQIYFQGLGVATDYKTALDYYRSAAEQGDLRSQIMLAFMYREGKGCEPDERKAFEWFQKAAEKNDLGALMEVAQAYREGKGVEKNLAEAEKWLLKGASLKDPYALRTLAIMYDDGELGTADEAKALDYFRQAASLGDVYSTLEAARILQKTDPEQAYRLLNDLSNQYDVPAVNYELALLEEKRGDSSMAGKLLQRSAEDGYVPAMVKIGTYHLRPFSGLKWNPRISYYWWNIAAQRGSDEAASYKAWLVWGGGIGMLVILAAAVLLLNRAIKRTLRKQEVREQAAPDR